MTAYVHTPRTHQPDRFTALLAEQARLEKETRLYETLTARRQELATQMEEFHKHEHPAELVRQQALITNADSPETCTRRREEAAADAGRWVDTKRPTKRTKR